MELINFDDLKSELLDIITTNLKEAESEIAAYIDSNKEEIESWSIGLMNGTLDKDLVKSMVENQKNVIEAILYTYALKLQLDSEEKAQKLALDVAGKLVQLVLKVLL